MKFTLCMMTARQEPRLDWVLHDLSMQRQPGDAIDVIVVDFFGRPLRELAPSALCHDNDRFRVREPKPTIWQGGYRVTKDHWWATASSRNTAIVLANTDYLVCIDDRCHLGPQWLESVRKYEAERSAVLIGSYNKHEDGSLVSEDHRRLARPNGWKNCSPGWLYGCSFGLPLDWALEINGFEEGCDSLTGEDYIFGLMLANADHLCDFVPEMFVQQDRSQGNVSCKGLYRCMDKGVSPKDKSHAALERFSKRTRTEFTPDLRAMRTARLAAEAKGEPWSFPAPDPNGIYLDWYDGQDIRTMV